MRIDGHCHCRNILLALTWGGDPDAIRARACQCSFCLKHGAVWTCSPTSTLEITLRDPGLVSRYAFGTGTADFLICARCGVVTAATSVIDGGRYGVVNLGALVGVDASRLQRADADFEGEATDARLTRRRQNWIADVRLLEG